SQKNTETMLRKLHDGTQQQWSEACKQFRTGQAPGSAVTLAGVDPTGKRAQVIWLKLQLRREFPMSYAEIIRPSAVNGVDLVTPADLPPISSYVRALNGRTAAIDPATESAACLLIALQNHPHSNMKFNAEESLGASAIKDTDGDGIPEIVDGFGKPILFYRWTCLNPDIMQIALDKGMKTLARDPEDPDHTLMNATWQQTTNGQTTNVAIFQALCHPITDSAVGGQGAPLSYYSIYAIVSSGKDGIPGVGAFLSISSAADANDNLYSFKVK